MDTLTEFQRKIDNRVFAINNSWKADMMPFKETENGGKENEWRNLENNLAAANAAKQINMYFQLNPGRFKKFGIIMKRAMRKFLKVFFGWYLIPIYQKQTVFNGKLLNTVSIERKLLREIKVELDEIAVRQSQILSEMQRHVEAEIAGVRAQLLDMNEQNVEQIENINKSLKLVLNIPTEDDTFYHDFEEAFRGERDEIKKRLEMYVSIIKQYLPDWRNASCIDVGSGRGEWLDILQFNGSQKYIGVDLSALQNNIAESFGHNVIREDCVKYLSEQPDESVDLITGFQIIEHLWPSELMNLLQQSYRTLKKGGVALYETPNPSNMIVAGNTFYSDLSHKRPLNPEMMRFWTEWCGFSEVKIIDANTHRHWEEIRFGSEQSGNLERLLDDINWKLYGPQDYAILAVK